MSFVEKEYPFVEPLHRMVDEGDFNSAFCEAQCNMVEPLKIRTDLVWLNDRLLGIRDDYYRMLHYFGSGAADPQRTAQYRKLQERTHLFVELLRGACALADKDASQRERLLAYAFFDEPTKPLSSFIDDYLSVSDNQKHPFEAIDKLVFEVDYRWLANDEIVELFEKVVNQRSVREEDRAFLLGAVIGNICSRHNRYLTLAVISSLRQITDSNEVLARQVVALAADMVCYHSRWRYDVEIMKAFDGLVADFPEVAELLRMAMNCLFKSILTPKIEDFLHNDMRKELNELAENVLDDRGTESEDVDYEKKGQEAAELFSQNRETVDKFKILLEWHEMDADVAFASFGRRKDDDFFSTRTNWYKPYVVNEKRVVDVLGRRMEKAGCERVMDLIAGNHKLCSSDKYSLAFMLRLMHEDEVSMLLQQLLQENEMMTSESHFVGRYGVSVYLQNAIGGVVKDFYRAFMLSGYFFGQSRFIGPFDGFLRSDLFRKVFHDDDDVDDVGSLFVSNGFAEASLAIYEGLYKETENHSADLERKYGLTLFDNARFRDALHVLKRANLIDDRNVWTKSMIAKCYFALGEYGAAIYHFDEVMRNRDLSLKELKTKDTCLKHQDRNAERALLLEAACEKYADEIGLFDRLAEAYLLLGKPDAAQFVIDKHPEGASQEHDVLSGLIAVVRGNMEEGASKIRARLLGAFDSSSFKTIGDDYAKMLKACGMDDVDIRLAMGYMASCPNI